MLIHDMKILRRKTKFIGLKFGSSREFIVIRIQAVPGVMLFVCGTKTL